MNTSTDNQKISRREKLISAQISLISITGKISGEVKELLSCGDKNKLIDSVQSINDNLKELVLEIYNISDALNLSIEDVLGGKNGNNI